MGQVRVRPGDPSSTHHASLTDQTGRQIGLILCDALGRPDPLAIRRAGLQATSLKISEGNPKYSDFEMPFTPIAQEDWSGGRAQEAFERDVTKFLEAYNLDTSRANVAFLGGLDTLTRGLRNNVAYRPGNVAFQQLTVGDRRYLAKWHTTTTAQDVKYIWLIVKRRGDPKDLTVELCSDSTGDPGTVLKTLTLAADDVDDVIGKWVRLEITSAQAVTTATKYHLKVYGSADDNDDNHWRVAVDSNPTVTQTKESSAGSSWANSGIDLYVMWGDAEPAIAWRPMFYEYRNAVYMLQDDESGAPQLWINGDRGAADANTGNLTRLNDGSKTWTADQWAGCVVLITEGPGSTEFQPWRHITGNDTTYLNVDEPWVVEHTTSTSYVILGSDWWYEMTGHGLAAPVTDILVVNDIVYFAMGDSVNVRRHREYNNAGTWTNTDWADDGTNKATHLETVNDSTDGLQVYRSNNDTVTVSNGDAQAWGTAITFGTAIPVGSTGDKITNIIEYVDPDTNEKILWVIKKGSLWAIKSAVADQVPLKEMAAVMSDYNGLAVLVHNVYLYFSFLYGMERYFSENLDDYGPTLGRGLPANRKGPVTHLAGYPGKFYAAIDAGADGYSSILVQNGSGYHDIFVAPVAGLRITRLHIQVVPGLLDRLYFNMGHNIYWLPLPSETTNPLQDDTYPYAWEGALVTSRIHAGMQDLVKLWDSLKVAADYLVEDEQWIEADYKVDDEDAEWTTISDESGKMAVFEESPTQEEPFVTGETSLTGKFLVFRLRLNTTDRLKTPVVRGTVVEAVSRVPVRFGFSANIRLRDNDTDLSEQAEPDELASAWDKLALLDEWADSLSVLTLRSQFRALDNKRVFIDTPNLTPYYKGEELEGTTEGWIAAVPLTQITTREEQGAE